MSVLTQGWSWDPTIYALMVLVACHELGLYRLARRSTPANRRARRRRSWAFYAGLGLLLLTIDSPIDFYADSYFYVHMIEHVILMFFVPVLVVWGAPWNPLLFALPVGWRRATGRFFYLSPRARPFRAVGRFLRNPWFALAFMNFVMVFWHIPRFFDLAENNQVIHICLMHASFVLAGTLFWLQIVPSFPMTPKKGYVWQGSAILTTNLVMTVLAISMSILTSTNWYPVYNHIPGVTLSPFADQQIGAAILWICGDFWALPGLTYVIRKAIRTEGSAGAVIDRLTGRAEQFSADVPHWPMSSVEASINAKYESQ